MDKYLFISTDLWRNPKYRGLSSTELAVLIKLAAWCVSNETGEVITPRSFREIGVDNRIRKNLISKGFISVNEEDNRMILHFGGGSVG